MTSRRKPYKTYTQEFKIEAVRLEPFRYPSVKCGVEKNVSNKTSPNPSLSGGGLNGYVRLMTESERLSSELAAELGIRRNQLYKWKEQLENKGDKRP